MQSLDMVTIIFVVFHYVSDFVSPVFLEGFGHLEDVLIVLGSLGFCTRLVHRVKDFEDIQLRYFVVVV